MSCIRLGMYSFQSFVLAKLVTSTDSRVMPERLMSVTFAKNPD